MIQLSENWRLTADEVQFILQKKNIRKQSDGGAEEVWVNKYYYPTLQMALLAYMTKQTRAKVRNYEPDELREIVNHIDGVYEKLAKLAGEWQKNIERGTENE